MHDFMGIRGVLIAFNSKLARAGMRWDIAGVSTAQFID
jgi:hypothetical protein